MVVHGTEESLQVVVLSFLSMGGGLSLKICIKRENKMKYILRQSPGRTGAQGPGGLIVKIMIPCCHYTILTSFNITNTTITIIITIMIRLAWPAPAGGRMPYVFVRENYFKWWEETFSFVIILKLLQMVDFVLKLLQLLYENPKTSM